MTTLLNIYRHKVEAGDIRPDPDQQQAAAALSKLATALAGYKPARRGLFRRPKSPPRGFYFYGGVGRGKSMLMDLFFAHVNVAKKRRVHFHAFMLEVHDFLHKLRQERGQALRIDDDLFACADHIAASAALLCFDEFQVKDVADAMILGRLFTALFDRGVVVIMTSNIAPDDLYRDGLQRDRFLPFIALLKEKLDIFRFGGETDYRLHRLAGKKIYFWPHDRDAAEALDRLFRDVAGDNDNGENGGTHAGAPVDIAVKGRVIHVPRAEKQVAYFSFGELCGEARSAVDYLELAKHFRVFVVANVPKLDDAHGNALLRFVTLVDTLYDGHAQMIISAAAPPDQLYRGGEYEKIFDRTVSRLMEMQSREYRKI